MEAWVSWVLRAVGVMGLHVNLEDFFGYFQSRFWHSILLFLSINLSKSH